VTPSELVELLGAVNRRWPHHPVPTASYPVWAEDLRELDFGLAAGAIREMARDGRDFPPTSGQVYARLVEVADTTPGWTVAWAEITRRATTPREPTHYDPAIGDWAYPPPEPWSDPLVQAVAERIGLSRIAQRRTDDRGIERAAREAYEELTAERRRELRANPLAVAAATTPRLTDGKPA